MTHHAAAYRHGIRRMLGRDPTEPHRAATPGQATRAPPRPRPVVAGYVVMRVALVAEWLRAGLSAPRSRTAAFTDAL